MSYKNLLVTLSLFFVLHNAVADPILADNAGLGQTIQINTRLRSFLGKPSWLLIIRDVDHGENIPYLFDFSRGNNFWIAFTRSRNYLITVSNLQFSTYKSRLNEYKTYRINNFCQLESFGRIVRGQSMVINITGDLTPDSCTFSCHFSKYDDFDFTIVKSETKEE